jgi:hypothetical protein
MRVSAGEAVLAFDQDAVIDRLGATAITTESTMRHSRHELSQMVASEFHVEEWMNPSQCSCSYGGLVAFREKIVLTHVEVEHRAGHADSSGLKHDLLAMLENQNGLHDLIFRCNGVAVTASKAIVAGRCDYFRSMLFGLDRSNNTNAPPIDDINLGVECPPDAFRIVLRFLYAGFVDAREPLQLITAHKISDAFALPDCKALCVARLTDVLSPGNAGEAALHAYQTGLDDCKAICVNYLAQRIDNALPLPDELKSMEAATEAGVEQLLLDIFARANDDDGEPSEGE